VSRLVTIDVSWRDYGDSDEPRTFVVRSDYGGGTYRVVEVGNVHLYVSRWEDAGALAHAFTQAAIELRALAGDAKPEALQELAGSHTGEGGPAPMASESTAVAGLAVPKGVNREEGPPLLACEENSDPVISLMEALEASLIAAKAQRAAQEGQQS
jgi:hypothetical protein